MKCYITLCVHLSFLNDRIISLLYGSYCKRGSLALLARKVTFPTCILGGRSKEDSEETVPICYVAVCMTLPQQRADYVRQKRISIEIIFLARFHALKGRIV